MEIFRQITANNIELEDYPFLRELAMEAYLIENENILKLDNQNFSETSVIDAEIALKKGRKNSNGRIDILNSYGGEYLGIVELKIGEINCETLSQLQDYLDKKEQLVSDYDFWQEEYSPKWVGVLAGSSISRELQEKLLNGYSYNETPIAGLVIKRFRNKKNEIFVISDTFFNYNYSSKDYSKFGFNGIEYNKGRLVNAVIKRYIELNSDITYSELKKVFPDFIQGSHGVFTEVSKAKEIYFRTGYKRYYIKANEIIQLKDSKIATCTQWNPNNIKDFVNIANKHNLNIEVK